MSMIVKPCHDTTCDLERAVDAILCMPDPERFTTVHCDSSLEAAHRDVNARFPKPLSSHYSRSAVILFHCRRGNENLRVIFDMLFPIVNRLYEIL